MLALNGNAVECFVAMDKQAGLGVGLGVSGGCISVEHDAKSLLGSFATSENLSCTDSVLLCFDSC